MPLCGIPQTTSTLMMSGKEDSRIISGKNNLIPLKSLQKFLKSLKKRTAVILLILSIGFVYVLFDSRGLIQRIRLESEKSSLENKMRSLEQKNASMQTEIEKLKTNDQEIERIAREKYFMHRNGEKIIKVQPK